MSFIYTVLYALVQIFIFPYEYLKRPKEARKRWVTEKFGNAGKLENRSGPNIWIHAVSVGEVLAALPLIKVLQEKGYSSIVVSTITDTGQQIAHEKVPGHVKIIYLPLDLGVFLNKAIRLLSPGIFITMETEIWPNLFEAMHGAGVPVFIFNGRISDKSFPRYKRIRFFLEKLFNAVVIAGVQTGQDAERFKEIGLSQEKVLVTGNLKFDIRGALKAPDWVSSLKGRNIVAGSTHEGEEEIIIETYLKLRESYEPLNLVIAPRHPQRFADVEKLLNKKRIEFIRRSTISAESGELEDVIIMVDTLGELAGLYSVADLCIIGGSFVPVGGHNLFEAAYWSKPIVCGLYMNNFPLTRDFEKSNAVRITDKEALYDILSQLLESSDLRAEIGQNAYRLFRDNSGAVEKVLDILMPFLDGISNERI